MTILRNVMLSTNFKRDLKKKQKIFNIIKYLYKILYFTYKTYLNNLMDHYFLENVFKIIPISIPKM